MFFVKNGNFGTVSVNFQLTSHSNHNNYMKLKQFVATAAIAACAFTISASAEKVVILHTNDTHSHIDPVEASGLGGVLRRKAVIDSVRQAQPNVILADAGDIVQGTLYFHLYKGEVEQKVLNHLGYDIQIMGNHEFDNGLDAMARMYSHARPTLLTTNYDLSQTPLAPYFRPYLIKETGGMRIGFIAINLDPKGMIAEDNYKGLKLLDWEKAANATAWHLKHNEKVDLVVAVTHIGFNDHSTYSDEDLAKRSSNIDIIIGGHSHTRVTPDMARMVNAVGDTILVTQTGRYGEYLGEITIDTDTRRSQYRLIPIDSRLDANPDKELEALIAPYRTGIDSLYSRTVATTATDMSNRDPQLLNFVADFVLERGRDLAPDIDLSIVNKGGIRRSLSKGPVSEGQIIDMLPFDNHVTVIELPGRALREAFDVMAARGGDGVSSGVDAVFDTAGTCTAVTINGRPLDDNRTYRVATIDYLANGGDYMSSLTRGKVLAKSPDMVYEDLLAYFAASRKNRRINPSSQIRMHAK